MSLASTTTVAGTQTHDAPPNWQKLVSEKRAARDALFPSAYLPSKDALPSSTDVTGVPAELDILSRRDIEIAKVDDIVVLLKKIATAEWSAQEVLEAYIKRAVITHPLVNPLTELNFDGARAQARALDEHLKKTGQTVGPLHGLPVSLNQFSIKGLDTTIGYVSYIGKPAEQDAVLTTLLRQAGAVPFVRTNLPQTIMLGETNNLVWGRTLNPHNTRLTCGGSSGGEGALVAMKGSPMGVGTDIGGSVRIPSAFCGIFGLRPSYNRLPYYGAVNSLEDQVTVPSVLGPLCRTISGLTEFTKALLSQKPWLHDPSVPNLPWDESEYKLEAIGGGKKLSVGVMWHDGVARPQPPYVRALKKTVEALKAAGHEVIDFEPLDHAKGDTILLDIFAADSGEDIERVCAVSGEPILRCVSGRGRPKISVYDAWQINRSAASYRKAYLDHWNATASRTSTGRPIDVLLCPPAPSPPPPHDSEFYIGYTSQWNLLDYPASVFPVTKVDPELDPKPTPESLPEPLTETDAFWQKNYSPEMYENAPIALQLVGRRYGEEALLGMTEIVYEALNVAKA